MDFALWKDPIKGTRGRFTVTFKGGNWQSLESEIKDPSIDGQKYPEKHMDYD